jgi:hypothetical protein
MTDIASSLEEEFAGRSQAERDAHIAHLEAIAAKAREPLDIRSHAILTPLLTGALGGMFLAFSLQDMVRGEAGASRYILIAGLVLFVPSLWALVGPRKPRFTLTAEGVRVKQALLPWESIDDYRIIAHSSNGFPTHTTVYFDHAEGFTPPALGLLFPFGNRLKARKTGLFTSRLTLYTGPRGMDEEKLAQRVGEYLDASRARAELARLRGV